jgi:hypothetical protein
VSVYACAIALERLVSALERHCDGLRTACVSLLKMTLSHALIPVVENVFAMHSILILTSSRASIYGL